MAVAKKPSVDAKSDPQRANESFMANIFRGKLVPTQVFPYPDILSSEDKELTSSLVPPFEKFFLVGV